VADDGPGIAPEEQERIFNRFYRAPTAGFNQGSGLGLPIARGMVELHGGRLWVESTPERGSTFVLAVPASTPGRRSTTGDNGAEARALTASERTPPTRARRRSESRQLEPPAATRGGQE
jgi:two-component system phosphate regulon sensor histidine kinase PhoR